MISGCHSHSGPDMPEPKPKKVVYLFGAGATHAELTSVEPTATEKVEERGLLMSNVSSRVIEQARRKPEYLKGVEMVSGTSGSLNIELLISLLENSKLPDWELKAGTLKTLVQNDILGVLTPDITAQFRLHKALFELHRQEAVRTQEHLLGLISLNYENVLDQAHEELFGQPPDYCLSLKTEPPSNGERYPILKLHGSFDWRTEGVAVRGKTRRIDIIPLGTSKSYDHAPYVFVWSRAFEMLVECDTLRLVGCSLSQNDTHLIELLFKAQVESDAGFDMEIIAPNDAGVNVREACGFFSRIQTLNEIEGGLVPDPSPFVNAFKEWLKYKADRMLKQDVANTRYLREVYT
jgi:hypothetical protein